MSKSLYSSSNFEAVVNSIRQEYTPAAAQSARFVVLAFLYSDPENPVRAIYCYDALMLPRYVSEDGQVKPVCTKVDIDPKYFGDPLQYDLQHKNREPVDLLSLVAQIDTSHDFLEDWY